MMPSARATSLAERIDAVRERIAAAAARAGRGTDAITLVAVSKSTDRATVEAAYELGLRHFGENRVQDASTRFVPAFPADATVHMIGQLQTNKVRPALDLFQLIESVDRPSLVTALAREGERRGTPVPVLIQVNIAGEARKAGCAPDETAALIDQVTASPWLALRGLMTIAPLVATPEETRPVFTGLRELRDALQARYATADLGVLSMGMSNDYEVAIEAGATEVRVGRAIFAPPD